MNHEDELQKKIEQGMEDGIPFSDLRSYKAVFASLAKEPPYKLDVNFADRVLKTLEKKHKHAGKLDYFWMAAGIASMLITLIITIIAVDFKVDLGFLKGMSAYKGVAVMAAFLLVIFQFLDKTIIKPRQV